MDGLGQATSVGDPGPTPRRGVGRPSVVAHYEPQLAQWLYEQPDLASAEILRRLRLLGYRGGKSALYELVRRLRVQRLVSAATAGSLRPASIREVKPQ
jgi:hypothetical protein